MKANYIKDLNNYIDLKEKAVAMFKADKLEKALDYVFVCATYAWNIHLGIWYDEDLENLLLAIGQRIISIKPCQTRRKNNKSINITYIVSFLSGIGGHSEVLRLWTTTLKREQCKQKVYVTNVSNLNYSYEKLLKEEGIEVVQFNPEDSYMQRIAQLRDHLQKDCSDIIILYINPNDVIAVTSLLAMTYRPYIILFNHADHTFWLGRNIIDLLIEWRNEAVKYTTNFRKINELCVAPLTTTIKPREKRRTIYSIPEGATLSLSVGNYCKVLGDPKWDYFKTIGQLLEKFPNHYHLFITNAAPKGFLEKYLPNKPDVRKRFIIDGPIFDLSPIYGMADFLIETFPCGGGLVRVEAMASGLPIVAIRNKNFSLLSETDALPEKYPFIASTSSEVIEYSSKLIQDLELRERLGEALYEYFLQNYNPENIHKILANILQGAQGCSKILKKHGEESHKIEYNLEYAYAWTRYNFKFFHNKILLFQSIYKQSEFRFKERVKFYMNSIKNNEFTSVKELFKYGVLTLIGYQGKFLYKRAVKNFKGKVYAQR